MKFLAPANGSTQIPNARASVNRAGRAAAALTMIAGLSLALLPTLSLPLRADSVAPGQQTGDRAPHNLGNDDLVNDDLGANDPLEHFNRAVFSFNETVDDWLIRPGAILYRDRVPESVKQGMRNVLTNLHEPVVATNDLLQGQLDRAKVSSTRFALNSTLGILGVHDVASEMGYPAHDEDFGQTLAVWGVPEGPYLVLPVIGPSNTRDAVGLAADLLMDPFNLLTLAADQHLLITLRGMAGGIDKRAQLLAPLDDAKRSSLDIYATLRDLYRQNRAVEIRNGKPDDVTARDKPGQAPPDTFNFDSPAPGD